MAARTSPLQVLRHLIISHSTENKPQAKKIPELPADTIVSIFSFLPATELWELRTNLKNKEYTVLIFAALRLQLPVLKVANFWHYHELTLCRSGGVCFHRIKESPIAVISQMVKLENLGLNDTDRGTALLVINRCANGVKILKLDNADVSNNELQLIGSKFTTLQEISVGPAQAIEGGHTITKDGLLSFSPHLKVLKLFKIPLDKEEILALTAKYPLLVDLSIHNSQLLLSDVEACAEVVASLQHLQRFSYGVTDGPCLSQLRETFPRIEFY